MSTTKGPLDHGRASFDRHAWGEAFEAFARAEGAAPLDRDDLERLAWSAALRGRDEAFLGALERLHKACVEVQECKRAARAAFWIGFHLSSFGATSAAGWLARASRLIENEKEPCAERGYLLLPAVHRHLAAADDLAAQKVASEAARIGERCGDGDLVALARNLEGRALVRQARIEAGLALLDEVMVAVTSGALATGHRNRLLQRHYLLPAGLRARPRARVDCRTRTLVQRATAARDLHRALSRAPRGDHAARRRVARGDRGDTAGV
jgi:hypothetical protein